MGLQSTPFTLTKVIQLYETKNSRHSTMIVGGTGSGKTTLWRTLQASLSSLCRAGEPNFNLVRVGTRGAGGQGGPAGQGWGARAPGRGKRPKGKYRPLGAKGVMWT